MSFSRVSIIAGIFLSTIIFSSSSFGFDLGGALNSIGKELEKGVKELEQGLEQWDLDR
jgi:hypothetical protein